MSIIQNNSVIISDQNTRLKLRSLGAGVDEGDITKLSLPEAYYFSELGVLPVDKKNIESAAIFDKFFQKKVTLIRYFRERGYISVASFDDSPYLRLYKKGFRPAEDRTQYLLAIISKTQEISTILDSLDITAKMRKDLVCVLMDSNEPVFLKCSRSNFD